MCIHETRRHVYSRQKLLSTTSIYDVMTINQRTQTNGIVNKDFFKVSVPLISVSVYKEAEIITETSSSAIAERPRDACSIL